MSATTAEPLAITEADVYDIPAEVYHADPVPGGSLSSTGARRLLEMTPRRWRYELENPPAPSPQMVLGTAVHTMVLGTGAPVLEVDADDWRTKAAKEKRLEAQAAGKVALLRDDYAQASAMADAVLTHPVASRLFSLERGRPEQAMFWRDLEFGIWRRALVDLLPHPDAAGRPILADLKTTKDASTRALQKTVANFGYHQQAPFYLDGYEALFPGLDPAFLFVFVESVPPYEVRVVELEQPALGVGAELNRRAMEIYRDCSQADLWPGHSPEIELVSLPAWASRQIEEPI